MNVTPHPALAAMYQSRCPSWCAARAPHITHAVDLLDDGEILVEHESANLGDDKLVVQLQRTVRWSREGDLIEAVDAALVGDETIAAMSITTLLDAAETIDNLTRRAGRTGNR